MTNYRSWEAFDPEAELVLQEEREIAEDKLTRKKKLASAAIQQHTSTVDQALEAALALKSKVCSWAEITTVLFITAKYMLTGCC
jgi:hypothetical protein